MRWKAGRQSVEEKAADELVGGNGQRFGLLLFVGLAVVFPLERDLAAFERKQALIGDGDAMRIAAEIFERLLGAAEGWFGIHDPIALFHGVQAIVKEAGIPQMFDGAREL